MHLKMTKSMGWPLTWLKWLIWITTFSIATVSMATAEITSLTDLKFTQDVYNVTIPENSLGKTFVTATTKMGIYLPEDFPVSILYYVMNSEDDLFKVEDLTVGNFNFLLIRTHSGSYGRLNREFRSEYRLKIKAVAESNGVSFETTTDVIVYVTDFNDLQPLFDYDFYNITVSEDTTLHTSIARVSAYDGDVGINAQIYYSFSDPTINMFAIHPTSGVITLTRDLNYYLQKEYTYEIIAKDQGPPPQVYRNRPSTVQVHVTPVNFFAPEISVKKISSLIEPGKSDIVLAIVNIVDRDINVFGMIDSLKIVEGDLNGHITLHKDSDEEYRVILKPVENFHVPVPGFNVTLMATDKGVPPRMSNSSFYVSVLDTTVIPKFSQALFNVSIEEIAPINTPVVFLTTVFSQSHFDVRYDIVDGNEENLFKINKISGLVSTSAQLDSEKVSSVQLKVITYDAVHKQHINSDSCIVNIMVLDNNDNEPRFKITDNVSEIYIQENLPVGSSIFSIDAIDNDKNDNGKVSFSIMNVHDVPFEIEPFTGVIRTTDSLDYETMRLSYKLNLRISDWGTPFPRENEMIFKINLQDMNDNEPYFEKDKCSGYVSRDAPLNTQIVAVAAIDFDVNDIIQYSIVAGNHDNCFTIHHELATVFLNCSLKEMPEEKRTIRVIAKDGSHSSSSIDIEMEFVNSRQSDQLSNSLVNIQCQSTDVFERLQELVTESRRNNILYDFGIKEKPDPKPNTPPTFNSSVPTSLEVSEGLAVGSVIAKMEAFDPDSLYDGKLVYVIKSGDLSGCFKVDMYTGGLMVMSKLDRELRDEYTLVIEVSDLGSPSLTTNTTVNIKILDVNDHAPKFDQDVYSTKISENILVNSTVTQVSASDADLGKNSEITYTIVSDTDHFSVNPVNGIIKVNKLLDRERHPVYTVLVRASDKGDNRVSLSSTATVLVELTDINDVVPEFTPDLYHVRIREDLPVGAVVTVVTAADTDEGKNGEVTYQLVYGEDYFRIDSETGVIRIYKELDYESQQVHNISVRAQDGGQPPLISVCFINIEVVDVNENLQAPAFENFFAHGYVNENEPVGTAVMFIKAYDPDGDDVSYSIRDGSGLGRFSIDSNGTINTNQVLDRETATHYWLTVYAQDSGLVPLYTRLEVYIEVKDTNDHIPMTFDPVYYGSVPENTDEELFVTQIQAYDLDKNLNQSLTYRITRYDPLNYFQIDSKTGVIKTNGKQFDREVKAEHELEVTVSDNGDPPLTYQTRVYVKVIDDNDNRPQFSQRFYRIRVPATEFSGLEIPVFQVLAWDEDEGENGELTFDIRSLKDETTSFTINKKTGMVYATESLKYGDMNHFVVRASDNGKPRNRRTSVKVRIQVVERLTHSANPPRYVSTHLMKRVMEDDKVGHMIELLQAQDLDRDTLFYSIIDGDPEHQFYIGIDAGNLVVARPLNWEKTPSYNLTIQATDGRHFVNCSVYIEVIDINDNRPMFESLHYEGSYPESTPIGTSLLKVTATDDDDNMLIYTLPRCCNSESSRQLFSVNPETGDIIVKSDLDHEVAMVHNLTVMVSDQGMSPNRNFTRVTLTILDNNDHEPRFLSEVFYGRVFETSSIGTTVVQVMAVDEDKGQNAELTFSILSGNVGSMFKIHSTLGTISVAKELDRNDKSQYDLVVMAMDSGDHPLSDTAHVIIDVTISDNAPPRFQQSEYIAKLQENQPWFTNVYTISAQCRSSVIYTIVDGNNEGIFALNPNSGVVYTKKTVDYERDQSFNLTIRATSIIHSSAETKLVIHILDMNDNSPEFIQKHYIGNISESSKPGSIVLNGTNEPLVVLATDKDTDLNAVLMYEIRDKFAKNYVNVDPNTGALRTVAKLDHEVMDKIEFSVEVWDMGQPQLRAQYPARVTLYINDVNDTPPKFSADNFEAEVLLPTYQDVVVVTTSAYDADTGVNSQLIYSINSGNSDGRFRINEETGSIYIVNESNMADSYRLTVQVTDGLHKTETNLFISIIKPTRSPFIFSKDRYEASIMENQSIIKTLTVVQVVNRALNQQLTFTLLNGDDKFDVGFTSGVVTTRGIAFDREDRNIYNLVVEVRGMETNEGVQKAHSTVMVYIQDENDNKPIFIHQPYHAVLVHDSILGHLVKQVTAIDQDSGDYGDVIYGLKHRDSINDRFAIDPVSGKITVFKSLLQSDIGKDFILTVVAEDKGSPSHSAETSVKVTVISENYPVFEQQVYHATIPEYYPVGISVVSVSAFSPTNQKLIYTIIDGDRYGDFDVDFNIAMDVESPCLVTVKGIIDYTVVQGYNLTIQAIEVVSGLTATAIILVKVEDLNNFRPSFDKDLYKVSISEVSSIGSSVLMVTATDPEDGKNGLVHYSLITDKKGNRDVESFTIDSDTGLITTKKNLDRETKSSYSFLVKASDSAEWPLYKTAAIKVDVSDLNDNPPIFDQISYHCTITDLVVRGQFVMKVSATDPDVSSLGMLRYSIIGGNSQQMFEMEASKGIIKMSERRNLELYRAYELNISVSDGVFTSFSRVDIRVLNSNNHSPRFKQSIYVAEFPENYGEGMMVTQVSAVDGDPGDFGMITYSIPSEEMLQYFRIDADTGEIFSVQVLDREVQAAYRVPVAATDNGGRMAFTTLHVGITDQNDNVPQFLAQEYKSTLLDTTPINSTVLLIGAEDPDSGENGKIIYTFAPGTSDRIKQMMEINSKTGEIILLQSLKDSENEIFQFFIQASDEGTTPMKNSVSVSLWVTSNSDAQPVFTQPVYSFFQLESESISTVIATVKAVSSLPLEYIIVPGFTKSSNAPARFNIDSNGRIRVANIVDMETTSSFTLTIQAQTLGTPPLVRQATVNIRLMDVNDNYPYFESNPYMVTVPENTEAGIDIVQVVAHDLDRTSKFTYSFGDNVHKYSHQFGIDSSTGVVTLLSPLDREQQEFYNLTIWVKDSDKNDALQNFTIVKVKVIDHNDNPPVFTRTHYNTAVNEDAYPGTILMTLTTLDKDLPSGTDTLYYIIDGDPEGKFRIRKNGDIFVNRALDRETTPRYNLVVIATDGGFVSTATVDIDILDANDNTPVCGKLFYVETISEDVQPQWDILTLTATDDDEYGSLHFELEGEGSDHFFLEPTSGVLTAATQLDRETTNFYKLLAKAVDSGGMSCEMDVIINISDINDNAPIFDAVSGPISVSEAAIINTLVYRVSAKDADLGINGQIFYELRNNPDNIFKIDETSGLLQLAKRLDRETTQTYTITVVAKDKGKPQLSSDMDITINVLDENDNPPEFEQTTYWASVPESAGIGHSIIRILATSKDTGINAKISYFIQAGNDKDQFTVDPETGVIRTAGVLNHETVPGYVLTVRAQDHGEPPLSNTAYVQINVTDVNDNPPVFLHELYSTKIREDVQIGSKVIQVLSSDLDSDPRNKAANYSIITGDQLRVFDIHPSDGTIVVRSRLDRESVDKYLLHIRAVNYHMFADTAVHIEILDANDSPPQFTQTNYTIQVQEDRSVTSCIMTFEVTDDDLDPNGAPFTFDITGGDGEGKFTVDNKGNLCIAGSLNRQITADYQLVLRVFDNGTPAMYSDVHVEVKVIEESTYSPEVTNMDVSISSYLDDFPGGVIGKLKAVDGDEYDKLTYQVVSPNRHLFDIDKNDGRIIAFAGLDSGNYVINISVSDGKYVSYGTVDIDVTTITAEMIANSITIQFDSINAEEFVSSYRKDFQRVLKKGLNVRSRDVQIISVQKSQDGAEVARRERREANDKLDILFAVSKGGEFIPRDRLKKKVTRSIPEIEDEMSVKVIKVFSDICDETMCVGGDCIGYVEFDKDSLIPIVMDSGSFVSAKHRFTYECHCSNGFVGENCLRSPTSCDQNPCPTYKICAPHPEHGYQCMCPPGLSGRHCEKDNDNKCDNSNCHRGDSPITFSGQSYARWTLLDPIDQRLSLSLRIKTIKETASLMFAKGRVDYSILELVNGMVQYRFDCGSGEGLVIIPNRVTDGKWHTIMVERRGKDAAIFLDGQFSAITTAPGINDVLNLDTSDVYFGAEVETYANGYVDVRKGFRGCIEDIKIYNVQLPVTGSNAVALSQDFKSVEFSCRDSDFNIIGSNICSTFPCKNGGQCEPNGQNSYICKCTSNRFRGAKCEIDTDPCQRQPCLNNGICENVIGIPNEFKCKCIGDYRGQLCEYGKYCLPNPCKHGGTCIEGPSSYEIQCLCQQGFSGSRCESMIDVCLSNPCKNDGQCIQDGNVYTCNCSTSYTGQYCEDIILPHISSTTTGVGSDEIYVIAAVAGGLIILVIIFVVIRIYRQRKQQRRRANVTPGIANDGTEVFLNLLKDDKHNYKAENMLKIDNINNKRKTPPSPQPPPVPDRPASYTPSARDSINTLNNFDHLRSCTYGSAADDLEHAPNIPYNLDFLQTFAPQRNVASIQPTLTTQSQPDSESLQKEPWEFACQNILQNYMSDKHSDKLSKMMPIAPVQPMSHIQGGQDNTSVSSLPVSESEEDQQGYHWDTSDWAPEKSLPNISEVPASECPDSPGSASPHSNESNTHIDNLESGGLYTTDGEYIDSEYVGDSEYADHDMEEPPELPNYEELLAEQSRLLEDYEMPNKNLTMHVHPNYYLPINSSFTSADGHAEENWPEPPTYIVNGIDVNISDSSPTTSSEDDNDSVLHYGFPPSHNNINRLSMVTTDSDLNDNNRLSAAFTTDSDFNDGDYSRGSVIDDMSDISGLCEIEDSEVNTSDSEDENTPLTSTTTQRIHTEV